MDRGARDQLDCKPVDQELYHRGLYHREGRGVADRNRMAPVPLRIPWSPRDDHDLNNSRTFGDHACRCGRIRVGPSHHDDKHHRAVLGPSRRLRFEPHAQTCRLLP